MKNLYHINESLSLALKEIEGPSVHPFHAHLPQRCVPEEMEGIHAGDIVLAAGRPAMGKTALLLNLLTSTLYEEDKPIYFWTHRHSHIEVVKRLIAIEGQLELSRLRSLELLPEDLESIPRITKNLIDRDFFVDTHRPKTLDEFVHRIHEMSSQRSIGLLVIDHIDMVINRIFGDNSWEHGYELLQALKDLAIEHSFSVLCSAGISRKVDRMIHKSPCMADVLMPNNYENYVDQFMLIYRDEYYFEDAPDRGVIEIQFIRPNICFHQTHRFAFDSQCMRIDLLSNSFKGQQ